MLFLTYFFYLVLVGACSFLENTRVLHDILFQGVVYGMTILGIELFVVSGKTTKKRQVDVYDINTLMRIHGITIPNSGSLWSIVAWKKIRSQNAEEVMRLPSNNTLYISDDAKPVVHRYDLVTKNTSTWKVSQPCLGLSLTGEGNLLVVLRNSKVIHEYTPSGVLIQSIHLDSSISRSQHCIRVSDNHYVVSHIGDVGRVCRIITCEDIPNSSGVHKKGNIEKVYSGQQGSELGALDKPRHMVVDQHGYVLVADENNKRLEVLGNDPDLTHFGYIEIPGDPLNGPRALCIDEDNHCLYIGDTNRLLVLKTNLD